MSRATITIEGAPHVTLQPLGCAVATIASNVTVAGGGGQNVANDVLIDWTLSEAWSFPSPGPQRDSDGVVTTANVVWPDGSAGVLTRTIKNASFPLVDAFTVTHADSGKTVTQAAVTRDSDSLVTLRPQPTA